MRFMRMCFATLTNLVLRKRLRANLSLRGVKRSRETRDNLQHWSKEIASGYALAMTPSGQSPFPLVSEWILCLPENS